MRIVLFLGAGFSAPFDLPVMDTFLSFAENSKRISEDDKRFIDELVLDARRANSFLQSRPTNLEDILSFAIMGDRLGLLTSTNSERSQKIKKILQKIYSQVSNVDSYWEKYHSFKNFVGFDLMKSEHDLSIITTNYDLNIESALYCYSEGADPGFQSAQITDGHYHVHGHLYTPHGIPLFKLHGSVNWYEDIENKDLFRAEGRIVEVRGREGLNVSLPLICVGGYECKDIPIIIPPTFLKPEFAGPMRKIWSGAAKALEEAQFVAFVGYSFPSTDTEMRYFLARSFVNNARLRKIVILDKQARRIAERLRADASGFGSHFKELLEPLENDWTTSELKF
jgi:hypothetical protein